MGNISNLTNDIGELLSPHSYLNRNRKGAKKFKIANKKLPFAKECEKLWHNRWLKFTQSKNESERWANYFAECDVRCQLIIDKLLEFEEFENVNYTPNVITTALGIRLTTENVNPYEFIHNYYNILYCDIKTNKRDLKFRNSLTAENVSFFENIDYCGSYQTNASAIEKDDVVIDVGAGYGIFALLALKQGASKVYCFEPNDDARAVLALNRELNGYTKEQMPIYKSALGDSPKSAIMYTKSKKPLSGVIRDVDTDRTEPIRRNITYVDVITLDDFYRKLQAQARKLAQATNSTYQIPKIDFIKVSTNGNENLVLKGGAYLFGDFGEGDLPDISIDITNMVDEYKKCEIVLDKFSARYSHILRIAKLHCLADVYEM